MFNQDVIMCVLLQVYIKAITIFHTQISLLLSTALLLFMVLTIEFYGHQLIVTVSNVILCHVFFCFVTLPRASE